MTPTATPAFPFKASCTRADGLPAIPLVLGIVGDANPDDALRAALETIFKEFRDAYPHTPIVVISALAGEAEQLAARTALDYGLFVRVPLPSDSARTRLDAFRDHPHKDRIEAYVVPLPMPAQATPAANWSDEANAGGYLVRRCHALIALGAGTHGERVRGRVAEHVTFKLEGKAFENYPWTDAHPLGFRGDCGPVIIPHSDASTREVRVPKKTILHDETILLFEADEAAETVHTGHFDSLGNIALAHPMQLLHRFLRYFTGLQFLPRGTAQMQQFYAICKSVDDFNRDVVNCNELGDLRYRVQRLATQPPKTELLSEPHVGWLQRISAIREASGFLSVTLQQPANVAVDIIFVMTFLSVLSYHLYVHWPLMAGHEDAPEHHPWFLAGCLIFSILTILMVVAARMNRLDERRLDYRALAELLRLRSVWAIAGLGSSVADSYLSQLRGEMIWVRLAIQHIAPPPRFWADQFQSLSRDKQLERLKLAQKDWMQGQKAYVKKSHERAHARGIRIRQAGLSLFMINLMGMAFLLLLQIFNHVHPVNLILIGIPIAAFAGGLLMAYGERRSHEEMARQYGRMHVVLDDANIALSAALAAGNVERSQSIIEKVGHEVLSEHAQWLNLRSSRLVEPQFG
jgi:hypothetical protein